MKIYKNYFSEKESDVTIISESKDAILKAKQQFFYQRELLEKFTIKNANFLSSFDPIKVSSPHEIIQLMVRYSRICNVGPMATVAGALADLMLNVMKNHEEDFVPARVALVENGGEIAIDSEKSMKIALYAGENKLNLNVGFLIEKHDCPLGIATSSATVGHAISLGQADAVTIFAENATLADGAATRIANLVKGDDIEKSIKTALDATEDIPGIRAALISRENKVGQIGKLPKIFKIIGEKEQILKAKLDTILPGDYEIFK